MYSGLWIFVEWTLSHQFLLIWASCGGQDFSRQDFYPPSWIWLMKSLFLQIKTPSQIIIWVFFTWELGAQSAPSLLCNTVSSVHGHTKSDTTILWSFQRKTLVAISASFLELSIPLVPRSHPRTFLRLTLFSLFPGLLGPKSLLGQALPNSFSSSSSSDLWLPCWPDSSPYGEGLPPLVFPFSYLLGKQRVLDLQSWLWYLPHWTRPF